MYVRLLLVCLAVSFGAQQANAKDLELKEAERFVARSPMSLEYSSGTCTLWIGGNTHVISRVTLGGKRVESTHRGISGFAFPAFYEGRLLGVASKGHIYELMKDKTEYRGAVDEGSNTKNSDFYLSGNEITGGDIRPDGTWIISATIEPELQLFRSGRILAAVARMPGTGTFRGIAFDPVTDRTYALFRSENTDYLIVLGSDFELVTTVPLGNWGKIAEGIAVQPETGDIFISFLQDPSINGDIVRFIVDGLDTDEMSASRPPYSCATS